MMVADTDVLIDYLGGHAPGAIRVAKEMERGRLRTTVISRFELLSGARDRRQEARIRVLLGAAPALPLDEQGADRAAQVRRALEQAGEMIGMADSLIAGITLAHGGTLLTRNQRHFSRVAGLQIEDPAS
ncbi:MAG: type II toxin-antitoxin system VapC family toxin [Acidobacteria bacterium]|nr:type II toxin-antitoxin system VapC family toxin [Acidobacteriota bacterium]MBI3472248.1 type II toxin-antitoxin system VapC family toxin [Candidatus Solibacter usitatus]